MKNNNQNQFIEQKREELIKLKKLEKKLIKIFDKSSIKKENDNFRNEINSKIDDLKNKINKKDITLCGVLKLLIEYKYKYGQSFWVKSKGISVSIRKHYKSTPEDFFDKMNQEIRKLQKIEKITKATDDLKKFTYILDEKDQKKYSDFFDKIFIISINNDTNKEFEDKFDELFDTHLAELFHKSKNSRNASIFLNHISKLLIEEPYAYYKRYRQTVKDMLRHYYRSRNFYPQRCGARYIRHPQKDLGCVRARNENPKIDCDPFVNNLRYQSRCKVKKEMKKEKGSKKYCCNEWGEPASIEDLKGSKRSPPELYHKYEICNYDHYPDWKDTKYWTSDGQCLPDMGKGTYDFHSDCKVFPLKCFTSTKKVKKSFYHHDK